MHKLTRVYKPFTEWEEIQHGMWATVTNRKRWVKKAIEFTSDHKKYGRFMLRVVHEWPISCENALTDNLINKKAWVGHAAVALAINCPEDIVREAWGKLTDEQRLLANKEAERAIRIWEYNYRRKNNLLCSSVEGEMLF